VAEVRRRRTFDVQQIERARRLPANIPAQGGTRCGLGHVTSTSSFAGRIEVTMVDHVSSDRRRGSSRVLQNGCTSNAMRALPRRARHRQISCGATPAGGSSQKENDREQLLPTREREDR
jgi:hypothetical protein